MARFSDAEVERIRKDVKISEVVGQFVVWDKRKSNPRRGDMWACCPFHGEKSPSFHVVDSRGIYHCFGCGVTGDVFKFLMQHKGKTFPEAIEMLGGKPDELVDSAEREKAQRDHERRLEADKRKRQRGQQNVRDVALSIWNDGEPLAGTPSELYLRRRGIDFALEQFSSLRHVHALRYVDQATGDELGWFPALIAKVEAPDGTFLGIWRIYLDEEGNKADVPAAKMGLGNYTEAGGCVRLGDAVGAINACEGIETGLGIVGITGGRPVCCTLSTSGMVNFVPPHDADSCLIWPDGDVDRIRAVQGKERKIESPGMKAAGTLKAKLEALPFPTEIQPTPKSGRDYLDVYTAMRKRLAHGQAATRKSRP